MIKYYDLIPKLEERFPELKGKFSLKIRNGGDKYRVYINLGNANIITYIELRMYRDYILLAQLRCFLKSDKYISKYKENQKTKKYFYRGKNIVNYINRELICRGKAKKLEKSPKYKEWKKVTQISF